MNEIGITSLYHKYWNEEQSKETRPTFFLQKNLNKPYHIDYVFGCEDFTSRLKTMEIEVAHKWLGLSDHLPIISELR